MELEQRHLAPYLPYGLQIRSESGGLYELQGTNLDQLFKWRTRKNDKPLLHPWSNLTEEHHREIHNYDMLIMTLAEKIFAEDTDQRYPTMEALHIKHTEFMANRMAYCFEQHLDVFGLIDQGLAEPIKSE